MIVCAEMSVDSDRELESGDDKESDVRLFIIFFHYNVEAFSCFFNHCFFFNSIQMKILIKRKKVTIILQR